MSNQTILLADDDPTILLALGYGLRAAGFNVIEAKDGDQAINLCREFKPDLLILDMNMENLSGLDVAEWLNLNLPTPFIFLSGYDDEEIVQAAAIAGALGYLVKPVSTQKLLPGIRAALLRGRELHKLRENEQHLTRAVNSNRDISIAMGILMQRLQIDKQDAFDIIRRSAREQRRKTQEIAADIIASIETLQLNQA